MNIPSDDINPSSASPTKWSRILKQFVGNLSTNCLSVFDHFVGLVVKGLNSSKRDYIKNETNSDLQNISCENPT